MGSVRTYSSDNLVTDSAASGTAFACGVKTYNGGTSQPFYHTISIHPERQLTISFLQQLLASMMTANPSAPFSRLLTSPA